MAKVNGDDINGKLQNKSPGSNGFTAVMQAELKKVFPAIKTIVPRHMTPERLARMALTTISRTPKLAQCTPASLVGAVMNCAVLGLEPNLMGHAYLVPYWNSKQRTYECQFQIGYKGYIELIRRTGAVSQVYARKVYENDLFVYLYGEQNTLVHVPFDMLEYLDNSVPAQSEGGLLPRLTAGAARLIRERSARDAGEVIKYYAAFKLKDGSFGFQVVTKEQALAHAQKFSSSKSGGRLVGPWVEHFDAMALKTAIKEMVKYMPISIEIQEKLALDESVLTPAREGDGSNIFDVEFTVGETEPQEEDEPAGGSAPADGPAPQTGAPDKAGTPQGKEHGQGQVKPRPNAAAKAPARGDSAACQVPRPFAQDDPLFNDEDMPFA
ncbi:MAG: recombinase RecT [Dethiobacter sp.]|jgi:recombination protein RecT|nr:MAG: recombinase RecT [Dethiobacter sp.]